MVNLFLLLVLSHLIADYVLQTKTIVDQKSEMKIAYFLLHGLIVFLITYLLIFNYGIFFALKISLVLSASHIVLDLLKEKFNNIFNLDKLRLITFLTDQALHILIIVVSWSSFRDYASLPVLNMDIKEPYNYLLRWFTISSEDFLFVLIFYIFVIFAGSVFLDLFMRLPNVDHFEGENTKSSKYIGIVERGLILTLVTFGSISSVALIFAAKSLARFNKMSDKDFAEYYLLGTLTSVSIALAAGLILRYLLNFTY